MTVHMGPLHEYGQFYGYTLSGVIGGVRVTFVNHGFITLSVNASIVSPQTVLLSTII
jgi:hypothetical protein